MIQRIQSLYLFAAAVLMIPLFFQPLAGLEISDKLFLQLYHNRIESIVPELFTAVKTWPVSLLLGVIVGISLFTIFQYKKRVRQIRLCIYNIILHFGLIALIYFYVKLTLHRHDGIKSFFLWPVILPFLAVLFNYLALKRIQKDDLLIKSIDRLRH